MTLDQFGRAPSHGKRPPDLPPAAAPRLNDPNSIIRPKQAHPPSRLQQYKLFQRGATRYAQLGIGVRQAILNRATRDTHVGGNLIVGPAATGQHSDGELRRGQALGNGGARPRIMHTTPTAAKPLGNFDDLRELLRMVLFRQDSNTPCKSP